MQNFLKILFISAIFCGFIQSSSFAHFSVPDFQTLPDTAKKGKPTEKTDSLRSFVQDTSKIKIAEKIIAVKHVESLSEKNKLNLYNKNDLDKKDYRYAGNFFSYLPFGFVRDLGSIGQPEEIALYGNGFGNISYLQNGISINNRLTNSFDLNLFQSESIDSLEVIPITQGFLHNEMNNPVTVNFIPKEFKKSKPYTRIKFYQAPNEEGFFDGIFNTDFSKRLSVITEITHQSTDPRFRNSDYGFWAGSAKVRYLFNNDLTLLGNLSYSQSNIGLNGGIDADSIKRRFTSSQFEDILYSTIQAPVNFSNRYQKTSNYTAHVKLLANFISKNPTDINLYYHKSLIEFRQNEYSTDSTLLLRQGKIIDNNKFNTWGVKASLKIDLAFLSLSSSLNYESTLLSSPLLIDEKRINSFSITSKANLITDADQSTFHPSIFAKYLTYNSVNYFGFGADLFWKINNGFSFYLGASQFESPLYELYKNYYGLINQHEKTDYKIIEAKLNYQSDFLRISSGLFYKKASGNILTEHQVDGFNFSVDYKLWKLLFTTNTNFYFDKNGRNHFHLPSFTSNGGIYYIDTLFNSNLKLKTGINYYAIGTRGNLFIDFERSLIISGRGNPMAVNYVRLPILDINPSIQFDFFLAGKIQDNATLYIVFENLLNERYYIAPYYPKQERGLRFGVAWEFFD